MYTPELGQRICDLIAEGQTVSAICAVPQNTPPELWDEWHMPKASTVYYWLNQYPDFLEKYARAREIQTEIRNDEILDIADAPMYTPEQVNRAKLRIDARKWDLAHRKPKRWDLETVRRELAKLPGEGEAIERQRTVLVRESGPHEVDSEAKESSDL
jgi:hypothetical protein